MKKLLPILLCLALLLVACSNGNDNNKSDSNKSDNQQSSTKSFTTDGKKVKVPKDPKRIVVLHPTFVGALVKFGHKPVAVPDFVDQNKTLKDATKGIDRLDNTNVEQVTKQKPDLIITTAEDKNIKKLQKIAPTVAFNMTNIDYKDATKQIGELVGEKKQADKWVKDWEKQLAKDKKALSPFIDGKTATVVQQTPKGTMAFSDHLGRGTEIIYGGYGMKQPDKLKEDIGKQYAMPINPEQFNDYLGDIVVVAEDGDQKADFENTNFWKNLSAVQKDHVIRYDVNDTQYNDPISLEKQRDIFFKELKKMKDNSK